MRVFQKEWSKLDDMGEAEVSVIYQQKLDHGQGQGFCFLNEHFVFRFVETTDLVCFVDGVCFQFENCRQEGKEINNIYLDLQAELAGTWHTFFNFANDLLG